MALTTLAELKSSIARHLNVGSADISADVDDVINLSEKQIWHDLRLKEMEQSISATISSDVVALPSDFIDLKYAYYTDSANQSYWLKYVQAEYIQKNFLDGISPRSKPDYLAINGSQFIFGPRPDTGPYIFRGTYYRRLSQLNSTSVTDTVFIKYPEMYLYKACEKFEIILGRGRVKANEWRQDYETLKRDINQENKQGTGYTVPHY